MTITTCAAEVRAEPVDLHPHRLAAQDVLDLHVADLADDRALPAWSSSKTVGSVRTGMPRARARARRSRAASPGAEGIAIVSSSGSASSRIRGSSRGRAEHRHAVDARAPLERVVVDEADGREAERRVAQDLAQDEPPAVAGADDEDAARVAARAEPAPRALVDEPRDEPRAAHEQSMSRKNSASTPVGAVTVTSPLVGDGTARDGSGR